ncbi:GntR family transcriptional regulator [Isachenkonia alkalipeptolytica]|uniref:GntR family transcriptional regulator n=1 Tax=Isachenkonia alkalipeptolytica TaxID=2565777 RepID=A0AA43XHS1_9CLOT|nr:GntR family transcriptional regulator [Isachenkonia alkalipeptolytica]NBG87062.1 GntR family transcriptional regulator [Isachenkonia alkalipeptolytica]
MKELEGSEPIYIQIGDWLENEILSKRVKPEEKIYSQYKLSEIFKINPATALKGLNLLVEKGIVYKKRGLGMFVSHDALKILKKEHKNIVLTEQIRELVAEAKLLDVSEEELMNMLKKEMQKSSNNKTENNYQNNLQRESTKGDDQ